MKKVAGTLLALNFGLTLSYVAAGGELIECQHGVHRRRIEVRYHGKGDTLPCSVVYYKDTEEPDNKSGNELWRAQNQLLYCSQKALELREKLEGKWGWRCQDKS